MKTAILVDGAFFQKSGYIIWGKKTPKEEADWLIKYCHRHLKQGQDKVELYRIFYYDCIPSTKSIYNPLTSKIDDLSKSKMYQWNIEFINELKKRRKVALRLGKISDENATYMLKNDALKKLCNGKKTVEDLTQHDLYLNITQKGVDMKIGLDISTLALKKQVDQIILISGDSDFVPASKLARREGIDFILDPLWAHIKDDLWEHIDGLRCKVPNPKNNKLCEIK